MAYDSNGFLGFDQNNSFTQGAVSGQLGGGGGGGASSILGGFGTGPQGGAAPGAGLPGGGTSFFGEGGIASTGLGAIQTLGSIWNSFQQMKLAKDSLKFQKNAFRDQLGDQRQVYNTALEDRINSRYFTEGKSQDQADQYVADRKLA
jgi:hypothetical protein